jgi:hypothetical protein
MLTLIFPFALKLRAKTTFIKSKIVADALYNSFEKNFAWGDDMFECDTVFEANNQIKVKDKTLNISADIRVLATVSGTGRVNPDDGIADYSVNCHSVEIINFTTYGINGEIIKDLVFSLSAIQIILYKRIKNELENQ